MVPYVDFRVRITRWCLAILSSVTSCILLKCIAYGLTHSYQRVSADCRSILEWLLCVITTLDLLVQLYGQIGLIIKIIDNDIFSETLYFLPMDQVFLKNMLFPLQFSIKVQF